MTVAILTEDMPANLRDIVGAVHGGGGRARRTGAEITGILTGTAHRG